MKKIFGILLVVGAAAYAFAGNKKNASDAGLTPGGGDASFEGKIIQDKTTNNWLYITGGKAYFVSEDGWAYYQTQNPGYAVPTVDMQSFYPVSGDYLANGVVRSF